MASPVFRRGALFIIVAVAVLSLRCGTTRQVTTAPPPVGRAPADVDARQGPATLYPDPERTPGFINPDITQANIASNICNKKWSTDRVRPPSAYTTAMKVRQIQEWHLKGTVKDYEQDHLISLEVGGNPRDARNLWPELWHQKVGTEDLGARAKDHVENYVHDEVCFNVPGHKISSDKAHPATVSITLARGRQILANDWYGCYRQYQAKQPCK